MMVILDPMAGIGTTALCASLRGFQAVTVELEEKFVNLQKQNKEYVERKTYRKLDWQILQGDARELSKLLTERGLIGLTSPPYAEAVSAEKIGQPLVDRRIELGRDINAPAWSGAGLRYSDNPSNIGNLKDIVGITSPPYANPRSASGDLTEDDYDKGRNLQKPDGRGQFRGRYPESEGQIGQLPDKVVGITSPLDNLEAEVYTECARICDQCRKESVSIAEALATKGRRAVRSAGLLSAPDTPISDPLIDAKTAESPATIEQFIVKAVLQENECSANPFQQSIKQAFNFTIKECQAKGIPENLALKCLKLFLKDDNLKTHLIDSFTQLLNGENGELLCSRGIIIPVKAVGQNLQKESESILSHIISKELLTFLNLFLKSQMVSPSVTNATIKQEAMEEATPTYLSEMLKCYQEMAKVCKVLVVVIKDPTRAGKIRRLGRDTCKLLRQAGFKIVDYHRAILFEEQELQDLEGKKTKRVKGRLSFFKRLGWQKGQPVSAYEHILIAVRPELVEVVNGSEGLVAVTSPPYSQADDRISKGKIQDGSVADCLTRTYEKSRHSDNPDNIGNLKDRE